MNHCDYCRRKMGLIERRNSDICLRCIKRFRARARYEREHRQSIQMAQIDKLISNQP